MPIAILDPFSGISGDMTLGALIDLGLSAEWLISLPQRLGLDGVTARVSDVRRAGIACKKVDFEIPPQPHGRHLSHIRRILDCVRRARTGSRARRRRIYGSDGGRGGDPWHHDGARPPARSRIR